MVDTPSYWFKTPGNMVLACDVFILSHHDCLLRDVRALPHLKTTTAVNLSILGIHYFRYTIRALDVLKIATLPKDRILAATVLRYSYTNRIPLGPNLDRVFLKR